MTSGIVDDNFPGQIQGNPKPRRSKRAFACNYCRVKKVRCEFSNGEKHTCSNCHERGEKCVYALKRQTRRKDGGSEHMLDRIERMEAILKGAGVATPTHKYGDSTQHLMTARGLQTMSTSTQDSPPLPRSPPRTEQFDPSLRWTPEETANPTDAYPREKNTSKRGDAYGDQSKSSSDSTPTITTQQTFRESSYSTPSAHQLSDPNSRYSKNSGDQIDPAIKSTHRGDESSNNVASPENSDWEYHGPGSFLSICSKPGMDWVAEKTGSSAFPGIARTFSREITKPLKLDRKISLERMAEPDRDTAWRWVNIYFEQSLEAAFDIVIRSSFEARLHAHFENGNTTTHDMDAAWYALRNVVYAFGCRLESANTSHISTFKEASLAGWKYFENALSRHNDLIFCRTGLLAVQALVAMALYAEGIGSPSLEYMLISGAFRLAQSKGLHRQPGTAWGMNDQEIQHRNWIFWVLYSFEKHIAYRSGRTSSIDDDDVNCYIPTIVPSGSSNNVEFFAHTTKHAQISSRICKKLSTVQAYRLSTQELIKTACELDRQLREWRDALPESMMPGSIINDSKLPANLHIFHALYLHYSYFGSMIQIHNTFVYPWSGMVGRDQNSSLQSQITSSREIVAKASRNIILATKYIHDIQAWTPVWLVFYYPVLGLINLFVHVLKHPTSTSAPTDIALMDVVAGHFARLEFASSSELTFSFVRELSSLARLAVRNAHQRTLSDRNKDTTIFNNNGEYLGCEQQNYINLAQGTGGSQDVILMPNSSNQKSDSLPYEELDGMVMADFDMENWSSLLPSFSPGPMINIDQLSVDVDLSFLPI